MALKNFLNKLRPFCHYLTPVNLIESLLSISLTFYNEFCMELLGNECTFCHNNLDSP